VPVDSIADPQADPNSFTYLQVLQQHLSKLNIPSFYGAQFGHISSNYVLPIGGLVEVDADAGTCPPLQKKPSIQAKTCCFFIEFAGTIKLLESVVV